MQSGGNRCYKDTEGSVFLRLSYNIQSVLRSLHSIHAIYDYFTDAHHSGTLLINIHAGRRCATNADCRLAYWQVNDVNIVVKALTDSLSLNFESSESPV